jgi:hypothetical protein
VALDEAGPDGVLQDVLDRSGELPLVPDHGRPEALGEERAEAAVPGVVLPCVVAVEPLHRSGELLRRSLEDGMVVRRHQAPALEAQAEAPDRSSQVDQEQPPVDVVPEERCLRDAAGGDVEEPVGQTRAEHSSHPAILVGSAVAAHTARDIRPTSDTASRAATGVRHPSWLGGTWT